MKVIIAIILLMSSVSALDESTCNRIFYNSVDSSVSIADLNISNPVDYFNSFCLNLTSKRIPSSPVPILNLFPQNYTDCSLDINKTILWGSYDMDTSIQMPNIYTKSLNCNSNNSLTSLSNVKWFFKIEKAENIFILKGIKLWIILFPCIFILITWLVRDTYQTNKAFKRFKK